MSSGQTIVEKIVSRATNKRVKAGDLVQVLPIDKLYFNEVIAPPAILNFREDFEPVFREVTSGSQKEMVVHHKGGKSRMKVFDPKRVCFLPDHTVPSCSVKVAQGVNLMKEFASEQGIKMYKEGDGIEHTVVTEEGFVRPGEIVVATDSHTDTVGAIGALGFGIGTTEAEYALALGEIYDFFVPETYKFEISGDFQAGVSAKDLILHILGTLKEGGCSKRIAEYTGDTIHKMGMDGRFTMCNMSVEMSARTAVVNPDQITFDFMQDIVRRHPELATELSESMKGMKVMQSGSRRRVFYDDVVGRFKDCPAGRASTFSSKRETGERSERRDQHGLHRLVYKRPSDRSNGGSAHHQREKNSQKCQLVSDTCF